MTNWHPLLTFFLLLSGYGLNSQPLADTPALKLVLPFEVNMITADHLGNIYAVKTDNTLEKYNAEGQFLSIYSNNRMGPISAIDVTNPLEILIWFGAFRTAVVLDRNLVILGTLNLLETDYPEVRAIAMARDGNFWLYDETGFRLRKIRPDGNPVVESMELNLWFEEPVTLFQIIERDNLVYASAGEKGWVVFDLYGQWIGPEPTPWPVYSFGIEGNYKIVLDENIGAIRYYGREFLTRPLPGISRHCTNHLGAGRLFSVCGGKTYVFKL